MYICEKCGSIYFQNNTNSCKCGNECLERIGLAEISEYVCDNCKSHYRNYIDKCENCGSNSIRCYNKKEIIDLGEGKSYNLPNYSEGSLYLSIILVSAIIIFCLLIISEFAFFSVSFVFALIEHQHIDLGDNYFIIHALLFLFYIFAVIGIVFYLTRKNNYNNKLIKKKANWILIKNIDYELIPHKTSGGTRYKILARLITIGDRTLIKTSKELFDNPQGEFDLLIDLNNMDRYIIKQGLTLETLRNSKTIIV